MPNLKQFITGLAKKAGMDPENETIKAFFSALPETDVPEDVQRGVDNSLISLTDAKNNHPEIKNFYQKQSLDSVDKTLQALIDEYQLGDDEEIKGERSTYKRVQLIPKKIADLEKKKGNANGGKEKENIQKEIDALHAQLSEQKTARETEKASYANELLNFKRGHKLDSIIGKHKTIYDELDPDVKSTSISTIINKYLQDNQAKFDFDDKGNFVLLKNDGTNYYGENHQQISPDQFIEQTLAKTKLLKVSNGQSNGATNQGQSTAPATAGDGKPNSNASLIERNKQELANYMKAESGAPSFAG
jgi:hypothetical protein